MTATQMYYGHKKGSIEMLLDNADSLLANNDSVQVPLSLLHEQYENNVYQFEEYAQYPYEAWKPARQRIDFVNEYATGSSILDIACGGHPVTEEVQAQYKAGIDISIKAAELGSKHFDQYYLLDFTNAPEEYLDQIGKYDTIVASEFLEHCFEPDKVLSRINGLLNDDGRVLITIPNGESLAGKVDKLRNGGKHSRFKVFHKNHVTLLPQHEWEELFSDAGFKIKHFDYRPSDIVEGFPTETTPMWKEICGLSTRYMAHQYFYVLEKK